MKICKVEPRESQLKSWGLRMHSFEADETKYLCAFDVATGVYIGRAIAFSETGQVFNCKGFYNILKNSGYDPNEHRNTFNEDGSLVIIED